MYYNSYTTNGTTYQPYRYIVTSTTTNTYGGTDCSGYIYWNYPKKEKEIEKITDDDIIKLLKDDS